jgi:hypothetical protein
MKSTARIFITLALACALVSPSLAGPATGDKATKTAACKKDAKAKKLTGSDRRAFLKECVKKPAA